MYFLWKYLWLWIPYRTEREAECKLKNKSFILNHLIKSLIEAYCDCQPAIKFKCLPFSLEKHNGHWNSKSRLCCFNSDLYWYFISIITSKCYDLLDYYISIDVLSVLPLSVITYIWNIVKTFLHNHYVSLNTFRHLA